MKRIFYLFIILLFLSLNLHSQDCTILSKANNISPDKLCSPVTVSWNVSYTGVNDAGKPVNIKYVWDDGASQTVSAVNVGPGIWQATVSHTYTSIGDVCNYHPQATLVVNGVVCGSSSQQQIVTVWDNDDHNGGHMRISPAVFPVCLGNSANVQFKDVTQFNCVPPQEKDVPNLLTRWVQWIYGTSITMTGLPVTVGGLPRVFPYSAPIITLPGPVTGSGVLSDVINVANDKLLGQYWQITLRNWNYCNPYDDPNIPGPPVNLIDGDHPPVVTTAIILIVPYPDATITPVDTLCLQSPKVTLTAHDPGGIWTGPGVVAGKFDPSLAGVGDHIIKYSITNSNGCTDTDLITITVMPSPVANISPVKTLLINGPSVVLSATPSGGAWSGTGVNGGSFYPVVAGLGTHIIQYNTLPDRFGCSGTDTIHIKVIMPPTPEADFEPDTVGCSPVKVQFKNTSVNGESYLWDFGDKVFSNERNPSHTYYVPGSYIVRLTVTNIAGVSTHEGLIKVYQNPTAIFNVYPTEVINNSQVVAFYNYSYYDFSYLWKFGDGSTSTDENPWHKYELEGSYNVVLVVTSIDGCVDSAKFDTPIKVKFIAGEISFPNAFVWNRYGPTGGYWEEGEINDNIFRPHFKNVIEYKLQIFNRLGVLIFESDDLKKGWDGYVDGVNLAHQAVFVWKVVGRYANGEYFDKVGDVTFLH